MKNGALWDFETYVVSSMQLDERFDWPVAGDRRDVTQHFYDDHWTQEWEERVDCYFELQIDLFKFKFDSSYR